MRSKNLNRKVSIIKIKGGFSAMVVLLLTIFVVQFYASPQSLGVLNSVDPNFDVQIQTNSFSVKTIVSMIVLPDDKMLVSGYFNSFNRQPVTGLIRLTADGLLDPTFNNNLMSADTYPYKLFAQPDGKILVVGSNMKLNGSNAPLPPFFRLNTDGTIDSTFNFAGSSNSSVFAVDAGADGKILVAGGFPYTENGVTSYRTLLRLNSDGTIDNSFTFTGLNGVTRVARQNDKPIILYYDSALSQDVVMRLTSDGAVDNSFTPVPSNNYAITDIKVTSDNKVLVLGDQKLQRLNVNGGSDSSFQTVTLGFGHSPSKMYISGGGRITYADAITTGGTTTHIKRVLANGANDPTFTSYSQYLYGGFAVQSDGEVFVGDQTITPNGIVNQYTHLFASGTVDTGFNPGGIGFQTMSPGSIGAIGVQSDQKVIMAGKFDLINNINRAKIARVNSDNTIDSSFQLNMTATGNYFTRVDEIYTLDIQPNGKIIITGLFDYRLDGSAKANVVRLNTDGSIDSTFSIGASVPDVYGSTFAGKNKTATQADGKLVIATSRGGFSSPVTTPMRFTSNGAGDSTFNSTLYNNFPTVFIYDVAVQPDQKILISGLTSISDTRKSFIARLNSDGSTDESFQKNEELNKVIGKFNLLADGKILIIKSSNNYYATTQSVISRLNADGSPDATFNVGAGTNGVINATLLMPNGQILLGGKFTTLNGQARHNLALINADGSLATTNYTVNQEVLSLAIDGEGRVLVGGRFTTINVDGGENFTRSYVARLTSANRTRFDFDGDGRADLGVFNASTGNWSILNSQSNQISNTLFGQSTDRTAPADYDGDGKTDIAVYRPAQGTWYLSQSTAGFAAYQWGAAEDKPVAGDFDGDGRADVAVFRPSNGIWYILRSGGGNPIYNQFGAADDLPVSADFDGDGKTDIAVFRPSNGTFYWLASGSNNQLKGVAFGQSGDVPAIADYNGDGKSDLVVFRPSTGIWHQYLTTADGSYAYSAAQFGQAGDEPVAADYDGDGKADIAVRRQGVWHLLKSTQGYSGVIFGGVNAQAVTALPNQ